MWLDHSVRAECGIERLEIPEDFLLFLLLSPNLFSLDMNNIFIWTYSLIFKLLCGKNECNTKHDESGKNKWNKMLLMKELRSSNGHWANEKWLPCFTVVHELAWLLRYTICLWCTVTRVKDLKRSACVVVCVYVHARACV